MVTDVALSRTDILRTALDWHESGLAVSLAIVVSTWGSAPRPAGSLLAVNEEGEFVGSVSGGCIEGAVIDAARELMTGNRGRMLEFGVSDELAWEVGLACGGTVRVYVEPIDDPAWLRRVLEDRIARRPVALLTRVADGTHERVLENTATLAGFSPAVVQRARQALREDRSGPLDGDCFVQVFNPPLRLLVVGAVHITQALVPMARLTGYAVTLIDPRRAWSGGNRFPEMDVREEWPDAALRQLDPDRRTAVVTLSHDPKLDDPALRVALRSPAFYVGALGSRRTHHKRLSRLREAGLEESALARIHAPVGLDIGARSPAEIALSVLAEMTRARYRGQ